MSENIRNAQKLVQQELRKKEEEQREIIERLARIEEKLDKLLEGK